MLLLWGSPRARLAALVGVVSLASAVAAGACAPQTPPTAAMTPAPTAPRSVTPIAATPTLPASGGPGAAGLAATNALSARLGIPAANIKMVKQEAVDWPDTSLGCPVPGMAYAQVITPGYRLVLGVGDKTYEYHSDLAGRVVTCQ